MTATKMSGGSPYSTHHGHELRLLHEDNDLPRVRELVSLQERTVSGMDEAIELCRAYAEILGGTLEIDVRLVDQAGDDRARASV